MSDEILIYCSNGDVLERVKRLIMQNFTLVQEHSLRRLRLTVNAGAGCDGVPCHYLNYDEDQKALDEQELEALQQFAWGAMFALLEGDLA